MESHREKVGHLRRLFGKSLSIHRQLVFAFAWRKPCLRRSRLEQALKSMMESTNMSLVHCQGHFGGHMIAGQRESGRS